MTPSSFKLREYVSHNVNIRINMVKFMNISKYWIRDRCNCPLIHKN